MAYKISKRCVCCHSCSTNCPVGAITFRGNQYWINPEKCTSCGTCVPLCPQRIIIDEAKPIPTPVPEKAEYECDIVVIGAGGSGLIAAVRAKELSGKNVIVLEKAKAAGGSTTLGHSYMIYNSRMQREACVDNVQEVIDRNIRNSQGKIPEELIRKAVPLTGEFFDWLCEKGDTSEHYTLGYAPTGDMTRIDYPKRKFENLNCNDPAIGPGWAGTHLVKRMLEECDRLGIPVLYEHGAKELITDSCGEIVGVLAGCGGMDVRFGCKEIVMATGGFSGDDENLSRFIPDFFDGGYPIHRFSPITCSGDSIDMAEAVGGLVDMKHTKFNKFGPTHHPFTYTCCRISNSGCGMFLTDGRFSGRLNPTPMGNSSFMDNVPDHAIWFIADSNQVEAVLEALLQNPGEGNEDLTTDYRRAEIEFELSSCEGIAAKADTLEDLAERLGMSPENLKVGVSEYNELIKNPPDEGIPQGIMPGIQLPVRAPIAKGPFYAFLGTRFCEGAFGGVLTDSDMRVLRKDGSAFKNLYAVGDAAGTWFYEGVFGTLSEMTWAVVSGFIAGDNAGKL